MWNDKLKKGDRVVCIDNSDCEYTFKKNRIYIVADILNNMLLSVRKCNSREIEFGWSINRFRKVGDINCSKIVLK